MSTRPTKSRFAAWVRRGLTAAILPALLVGAAPAHADGRDLPALVAPISRDPQVAMEKFTLDNGLEVILLPKPGVPIVHVNVWYHVGSGYEVPGKSGFAHLFEHMLFQGSRNVGSDRHFDILKQAGSTEVNGTTNSDRTNYYETVPANQLELALWLESDRMGHILELVTDASFRNQVDVVRNERRQRYDNVAYGKTRFAVAASLFPEGHPYRYLTIGRHEDLEAATLDDVKNFFKTWYVPSNATLAISGDFDPAAAKALVQKWFGGFPKSTKPVVHQVPAPPLTKAVTATVEDAMAKLPQIQLTWLSPGNFAAGDAELDILADALGKEGSGRLYKALVHEQQLAQSVQAYQWGQGFSGQFTISVTLRSGVDLAAAQKAIDAELTRLVKDGLSGAEHRRAVAAVEAGVVWGMENLMQRAERAQAYNHYLGDPNRLSWDLDRYRRTTLARIHDVAKQTLTDRRSVVITLPMGGK